MFRWMPVLHNVDRKLDYPACRCCSEAELFDVSEVTPRFPRLTRLYQRYLQDEDSARFIRGVAEYYLTATMGRLVLAADRSTRRAATLALGFLGDYQANAVLGRALHDSDRGVRMISENAIRELWKRDGAEHHQQLLETIIRLNTSNQCESALRRASALIDECPWFAEAWNQRAIAFFQLRRFELSADDCQQTLELNPYHFAAAIGMGQCYLELSDPVAALECFRRGLKLNPNLEGVRAQIQFLQRSLEER
jgi:tetratricopeptide (TPR) repeat protein